MLRPRKHTDPSLSVLNVTALTIDALQRQDVLSYDDLVAWLAMRTSDRVREVHPYALSLLFLVGKLEYLPDLDAVRIPR